MLNIIKLNAPLITMYESLLNCRISKFTFNHSTFVIKNREMLFMVYFITVFFLLLNDE